MGDLLCLASAHISFALGEGGGRAQAGKAISPWCSRRAIKQRWALVCCRIKSKTLEALAGSAAGQEFILFQARSNRCLHARERYLRAARRPQQNESGHKSNESRRRALADRQRVQCKFDARLRANSAQSNKSNKSLGTEQWWAARASVGRSPQISSTRRLLNEIYLLPQRSPSS